MYVNILLLKSELKETLNLYVGTNNHGQALRNLQRHIAQLPSAPDS